MSRLRWLLLLSALGTAEAVYLAYVALQPVVDPFCTGLGECQLVQSSIYAEVAGIPVAILGLGMYLGLLAMLAARVLAPSLLPRPLRVWTFALALSGAAYSAYLTYLEFFVIRAICEWCLVSAAIVTVICILAYPDLREAARPPEAGLTRPPAV